MSSRTNGCPLDPEDSPLGEAVLSGAVNASEAGSLIEYGENIARLVKRASTRVSHLSENSALARGLDDRARRTVGDAKPRGDKRDVHHRLLHEQRRKAMRCGTPAIVIDCVHRPNVHDASTRNGFHR